jgi:hypothetical protein
VQVASLTERRRIACRVEVDLGDRTIETTINLGGQPDSIAVSPDGHYAAIAIENQRNESLNGGRMPQTPAGFLTIVDIEYVLSQGGPLRVESEISLGKNYDLEGIAQTISQLTYELMRVLAITRAAVSVPVWCGR